MGNTGITRSRKKTQLPVRAYRIGDRRYDLFDGEGAKRFGGRWNSQGNEVIYAALSQSGAMLETLANAGIGKFPKNSAMIVISIPQSIYTKAETVDVKDQPSWDHINCIASQQYGDDWITQKRSALLLLPAVIAPHDSNLVINTLHPDFNQITASKPEVVQWDRRLKK